MEHAPRKSDRGGLLGLLAVLLFPVMGSGAQSDATTTCLPTETVDRVMLTGGSFTAGADPQYAEEMSPHTVTVAGFSIDTHEVTNAQFSRFVAETGYVTLAEHRTDPEPGGFVFVPPVAGQTLMAMNWWRFVPGANWRHPDGPESGLDGKSTWPVVQIAYEDAAAYARWAGGRLPTEAEWEYAAQQNSTQNLPHPKPIDANIWHGEFPYVNEAIDGYIGIAPVGCYKANTNGLYDMLGNVWELTTSPYYPARPTPEGLESRQPFGHDPAQPGMSVMVIKGGSYLCATNFCARFRPAARQAQDKGLTTSHIGFRLVYDQ